MTLNTTEVKVSYPATIAVAGRNDLYLRLVSIDDIPEYIKLVETNRHFLSRYQPWVRQFSAQNAQQRVAESLQKMEQGNWLQYRIIATQNDAMVGTVTLYDKHVEDGKTVCFRGTWRAEDEAYKGFGTAAAIVMSEFAFSSWGIDCLRSEIEEGNLAAEALAKASGMQLTATISVKDADGERTVARIWQAEKVHVL